MQEIGLSHVYLGLVAMGIALGLVSLAGRPSLKPTKFQAFWEGYVRFVRSMLLENIGHEGLRYVPLIASIGLFVFFSNLLGMVPGLEAPTANVNTNLAMALVVFLLYNIEGFRLHGIGYLKHYFPQGVSLFLPFCLLLFIIALPLLVDIRARKPLLRLRLRLEVRVIFLCVAIFFYLQNKKGAKAPALTSQREVL